MQTDLRKAKALPEHADHGILGIGKVFLAFSFRARTSCEAEQFGCSSLRIGCRHQLS